jgi:hypothetical protein
MDEVTQGCIRYNRQAGPLVLARVWRSNSASYYDFDGPEKTPRGEVNESHSKLHEGIWPMS